MKVFKRILQLLLAGALALTFYYFYPEEPLPTDKKIDKLVVEKSARKLKVYSNDELLKTYTISLGFTPKGHKEIEGDGKTPVGTYSINDKNPNSGYHLNLGVSYPNAKDRSYAKTLGKSPGGDIKIHGMKNGFGFVGKFHRFWDWTHGCIAVTDAEIEELFHNVPVGTQIILKD